MALTLSGSTNLGYGVAADTDGVRINNNGTTVATFGTTGKSLALEGASVQTGTGITFPATQVSSTNANTLDDYEEGTWTPVIKLGTTTQSTSGASTVVGTYTKIGRVVYVQATIDAITKSGTGDLYVEGLPFTVGAGGTYGFIQGTLRWDDITSSGFISPYFETATARFQMQDYSSTGFVGVINNTNCSATYRLYGISGFYFIA